MLTEKTYNIPGKTPSSLVGMKSKSASRKQKSDSSLSRRTSPNNVKKMLNSNEKSTEMHKKKSIHKSTSALRSRKTSFVKRNESGSTEKSKSDNSSPSSSTYMKKSAVIKLPEHMENGLKIIDHSGQGMMTIPTTLLNTKDVGAVILASNNLHSLPKDIHRLKTLVKLDLSHNAIRCTHPGIWKKHAEEESVKVGLSKEDALCRTRWNVSVHKIEVNLATLTCRGYYQILNIGLPTELLYLKDLKVLNVSECSLPYVPPAIWNIKSLQILDLSRNKINVVPPEIGQLKELKHLNLKHTNITSLPSEIANCQNLDEMLLWGNNIEALPDTLAEMQQLRLLFLNYRSFCSLVDPYMENLLHKRQINSEHIPLVIFELPALEVLDLESTKLNNLPDMYNIALKELYLNHNFFCTIPEPIFKLKYLQILDISHNALGHIPQNIGRLKFLTTLQLNDNNIEQLPPCVGQLERLIELNLAGNNIRCLPAEINNLIKLKTLNLEGNDLQFLPNEICELIELTTLNISNNAVNALPIKLYKLHNLKKAHCFQKLSKHGLWLSGNPLKQPPPDVWQSDSTECIYKYLKTLVIKKTEHLQQQKVFVLGDSQVGKTSLVRSMINGKSCIMKHLQDATHLLEQTKLRTENNVTFLINDFGGNDAYNLMYHLFLDRKSIAIIVYDVNKIKESTFQQTIVTKLQMLTCLVPGIVVKLVGTKSDLLQRDEDHKINTHQTIVSSMVKQHLSDQHKQLHAELDIVNTDLDRHTTLKTEFNQKEVTVCETLTLRKERLRYILSCPLRILPSVSTVSSTHSMHGIQELISDLEYTVINQSLFPHAQNKVPHHWNRLKAQIKKKSGHYLLWNDVATAADFLNVKDQELIDCLQHICDTGEMLWYRNNPGLLEIIFHKPKVVIDVLSSLIRHDIQDYLCYQENKIFYCKERFSPEEFEIARYVLLNHGQVSRSLLNCLWFYQEMSKESMQDILEMLPLLHLAYVIPDEQKIAGISQVRFPLLEIPYYNRDNDLSFLSNLWPDKALPNEKSLSLVYHFPIILPDIVFWQISIILQNIAFIRMDWQDVIYAGTENEKLLLHRQGSSHGHSGTLMLTARGSKITSMHNLLNDIMHEITNLLRKIPGLYFTVEIRTNKNTD